MQKLTAAGKNFRNFPRFFQVQQFHFQCLNNLQELEDELTFHYKDEDFESFDDFEEPIDV